MAPLLWLISPFPFYTYIKGFFEHHRKSVGLPKGTLLECGLLTLFILRFFALQLAINYGLTSHLPWDPMAQYIFHYRHLYAGYTFHCLAWLGLYALLTNWLLFLKTEQYTSASKGSHSSALSWQAVVYDLIVRNVDQAAQCTTQRRANGRFAQLVKQSIREKQRINKPPFKCWPFHPFNAFLGSIHEALSMERLDLDKLCRSDHQLSIFRFLLVKQRKKVLQFHLLSSAVSRLFQWLSFTPILLVILLQLLLVVPAVYPTALSLSGWLHLLSDMLLIGTFGWFLFRNVLLFVYLQLLPSAAYRWHLQVAHRMLAYLSRKYRSGSPQDGNTWERLLLGNLLREYAAICALLDGTNRQLTSQASFFAFLCNCPTNIYLIYRLLYHGILPSEFTVILLFTACQILCLSCAFVPLAQANRALYQTGHYLPAIQLYVLRGGNHRPLKVKYEILQSTLSESKVKSGATIGPLCLITFESLYKVVTLYAVYMLAFFALLPK